MLVGLQPSSQLYLCWFLPCQKSLKYSVPVLVFVRVQLHKWRTPRWLPVRRNSCAGRWSTLLPWTGWNQLWKTKTSRERWACSSLGFSVFAWSFFLSVFWESLVMFVFHSHSLPKSHHACCCLQQMNIYQTQMDCLVIFWTEDTPTKFLLVVLFMSEAPTSTSK